MGFWGFGKKRDFPTVEIDGKRYSEVCNSDDIYEGKGKRIQFPDDIDMQVAIFRLEGKLYALENICPHQHADRIFEGIVKSGNVTCPLHGWTYEIATGHNVNRKQGLKGLIKYAVFERDGKVYLEKPGAELIPKWRRENNGRDSI